MIKTFISPAGQDDKFVDFIYEKLIGEDIGLDIFVDHKTNMIGSSPQCMIDKVRNSIIFIIVMSKHSIENKSFKEFIGHEFEEALKKEKNRELKIFPIRLEIGSDDIPKNILATFDENGNAHGMLWADFANERDIETNFRRLVEAIQSYLIEQDLFKRDINFLQDLEHIDRIIKKDQPTAAELKIIFDVYLKVDKYANYIFSNLEDLKWLDYLFRYRAFENSGKSGVLRWSALSYLEKVSKNISIEMDERHCNIIMKIIRDHTQLNELDDIKRDFLTYRVFIKILSNLPQKYVKLEDLKAISVYFNDPDENLVLLSEISDSLFPKLIELGEIKKAEELFKIVLNDKNGSSDKPISWREDYWLNELIEKNRTGICKLFPLEAAQIAVSQMEKIIKPGEPHFFGVAAIEDHPQNVGPSLYENILVRFVRDSILSAMEINPAATKKLVMGLLQKEHPIFNRISIYIASVYWTYYSEFFGEFFKDIFSNLYLHHEVYKLLKNDFELFSLDQKSEIVNLIETYDDHLFDNLSLTEKEVRLADIKQKWFSAIKDSGFSKAKEQYDYYKGITNLEPEEHPDFLLYHGEVQVGSISPLKEEELLAMSHKELAIYLNQYKGEKGWFGKPSKEGLKDALTELVRKTPEKFATDLDIFLEVQPEYQYHILRGFDEARKRGMKINWEVLLDFCKKILDIDGFWNHYYQTSDTYYRPIVSQISILIIEGTRNDVHAIEKVDLPLTEEIIIHILSKLPKGSSKIENSDLSMYVLNSEKGLTILAALQYSFRYANVNESSVITSRFPTKIKEEFSKRLDRCFDDSLEFSYIMGKYVQYLLYLDKIWVEENINAIFPLENKKHWCVAMEGHLGHLNRNQFNENLFYLMKENGHYLKVIQTEFQNKMVRERLVDYACISYLNNLENESDTEQLFEVLISKWNTQDIIEIIRHFGSLRISEDLSSGQKEKILLFWKIVYDHYSKKDNLLEEDMKILSNSCKLAFILDTIDENAFKILCLSTEYLNVYNSRYFIEDLLRLVEKSPKQVELILLNLLDRDIFPYYMESYNRSMIEKLYKNDQKSIADVICNKFMAKGHYYVRDIYTKNS